LRNSFLLTSFLGRLRRGPPIFFTGLAPSKLYAISSGRLSFCATDDNHIKALADRHLSDIYGKNNDMVVMAHVLLHFEPILEQKEMDSNNIF
jgi:hypothetical protein